MLHYPTYHRHRPSFDHPRCSAVVTLAGLGLRARSAWYPPPVAELLLKEVEYQEEKGASDGTPLSIEGVTTAGATRGGASGGEEFVHGADLISGGHHGVRVLLAAPVKEAAPAFAGGNI